MAAYLLDTNIWLRVVQREAPQHPLAVEALATLLAQGHEAYITLQNLIEFWSVASRPVAANGLGWPVEVVQQEIDHFLTQFPLLDDIPTIFPHWCNLVMTHQVIGRRVHDARLVAVMIAHNVSHLLTFNRDDFQQFNEIVVVEPAEVIRSSGDNAG